MALHPIPEAFKAGKKVVADYQKTGCRVVSEETMRVIVQPLAGRFFELFLFRPADESVTLLAFVRPEEEPRPYLFQFEEPELVEFCQQVLRIFRPVTLEQILETFQVAETGPHGQTRTRAFQTDTAAVVHFCRTGSRLVSEETMRELLAQSPQSQSCQLLLFGPTPDEDQSITLLAFRDLEAGDPIRLRLWESELVEFCQQVLRVLRPATLEQILETLQRFVDQQNAS